jgi:adenylate cyclase
MPATAVARLPEDTTIVDQPPCRDRKLAAILMADAVAFTQRVQDDERGTLAALQAARRLMARLAATHCGRVVDTAGDSMLLEFPSAVGAVAAAQAFQTRLAAMGADLAFRIGIDLGDVIAERDGTIFGDTVNRAARLQSLAEPRTVLVSRTVREEVNGRLPAAFHPRGRHRLKNMRQSMSCFEVTDAGQHGSALVWSAQWGATAVSRAARRPVARIASASVVIAAVASVCLV